MKEDEFQYLLRLLDGINEDLFQVCLSLGLNKFQTTSYINLNNVYLIISIQECMQIYHDLEERKCCNGFSESALTFIKDNLRSNPVTISTILAHFQNNLIDKFNVTKIQETFIEILDSELKSGNNIERFIALISLLKLGDDAQTLFIEKILKYVSGEAFKQHRKQILLSLMPQERPNLIKLAAELMRSTESQKVFKLTPEYMLQLIYQEKIHWLLKAAQVYKSQLQDMKNVTFRINNFTKQILIMVLIDLANSPETYDLPSLVHQLTNIFSILDTYTTTDEQLQYYMTEVKRELTIIKFCLENNCKIMTTSVFSQMLTQSALAVISQLCRLSKVDRYKVSRLLSSNNDTLNELCNLVRKTNIRTNEKQCINWDTLTYNSYCAISKIIDAIMVSSESNGENQDISPALDEIKRLVLSIQPVQYSIEVIENLFSCLFLRYEYFSCDEHNQDLPCGAHSDCSYFYSKKQNKNPSKSKTSGSGFMCNSLSTQVILNTLKLCLESIEEKLTDDIIEPTSTMKFKHLVKVVNHALWKMQLVTTLSPDVSPLQLKLCLNFLEEDDSSGDDDVEADLKVNRKKVRSRRKHHNKSNNSDQLMVSSTVSANGEGESFNH